MGRGCKIIVLFFFCSLAGFCHLASFFCVGGYVLLCVKLEALRKRYP